MIETSPTRFLSRFLLLSSIFSASRAHSERRWKTSSAVGVGAACVFVAGAEVGGVGLVALQEERTTRTIKVTAVDATSVIAVVQRHARVDRIRPKMLILSQPPSRMIRWLAFPACRSYAGLCENNLSTRTPQIPG